MVPEEVDLWYCHPSTSNDQIKLLAQPIAFTTLAKYSGLFHDLYGSSKMHCKIRSQTSPVIISYTLRGPSVSAFRVILNCMLRSANLARAGQPQHVAALGSFDSLGPLATINHRSKSYTTLAQLRLTAKILRIPYLELMFLKRMQQYALDKPLVSQVDLNRLLTCGDFELQSTPVAVMVRALAERYMHAEQADNKLQRSEIWALITSQQQEFIQAVEEELRKRKAVQLLPKFDGGTKLPSARSKAFAPLKQSAVPEKRHNSKGIHSKEGGLADLPTIVLPLSSCSCICTCDYTQESLGLHSVCGNEYNSLCCSSCCPAQRANQAFFKTGLGDDPFVDCVDTTDKVQNWRLHSALAAGKPRSPTGDLETPTKVTSRPFVQSTSRPTSTRPPPTDVSLANFIPALAPFSAYPNLCSSPAAAKLEGKRVDTGPPSPTKVIKVIAPPFLPSSPCTIVRKTYDGEGNEKLEMVRPKAALRKERNKLEQSLSEYMCCSVM